MKRINRNPLRKIIRKVVEPFEPPFEPIETGDGNIITGFVREELECGHVVQVRQDFYGETNATKRRCSECAT